MKKQLILLCGLTLIAFVSGCSTPVYVPMNNSEVVKEINAMTLEQAKNTIDMTLLNVPAGRRPVNPGYEKLAKYTTGIQYSSRRGYCLVELVNQGSVYLKFYTRTETEGRNFGVAVARLQKEYVK